MTDNPASLKKRLSVEVSDGHKAITIKQGGISESIIWGALATICVFLGATHLYSDGSLHSLAPLPASDIAKVYGWMLLAVLCSLFVLWNTTAYEVITARGGHLLTEIKIGSRRCLSRRTYLISDIKNLRLSKHTLRRRGTVYWTACFDCRGKEKQLETRCYTKEDGNYFLDCLRPMLAAVG